MRRQRSARYLPAPRRLEQSARPARADATQVDDSAIVAVVPFHEPRKKGMAAIVRQPRVGNRRRKPLALSLLFAQEGRVQYEPASSQVRLWGVRQAKSKVKLSGWPQSPAS